MTVPATSLALVLTTVLVTPALAQPDGQFDRQTQVFCAEGDGKEDGLFLLGDGRVLLIKGYVDAMATMFGGAMELICYRASP
jgi:hypothetical protein